MLLCPMTRFIDLNADVGESYGGWQLGSEDTLMPLLSSANIACGFHAGDPRSIRTCIARAQMHDVALGAHPGFPDLVGFGRRNLAASPDEVYTDVLYQLGALEAFVRVAKGQLHHVKPHGALYMKMHRDAPTARAVAEAVAAFDSRLPLVIMAGPGGNVAAREVARVGVDVVLEAFPDRAYTADGHLAPRTEPNATLHDPQDIAERAAQMVLEGSVTASTGETVPLSLHTLCLHGDNPAATEAARAVRTALTEAGVAIRPF